MPLDTIRVDLSNRFKIYSVCSYRSKLYKIKIKHDKTNHHNFTEDFNYLLLNSVNQNGILNNTNTVFNIVHQSLIAPEALK
jgi:uncharacterized metal-binding protein